ncbi:phosphopantetheine-binding protein [Asaia astilbis]|uniref:phosphopantetheine-binding protein n=1 Tax=Asaia astilbis TaxID=610244 RepID=UPI0012EB4B1D|nr:phosphopantetheine-binding protein [Asaia astilbis]
MLARHFDVAVESITPETRFSEDLSADSFDIVELLFEIEEKAGIAIHEETFPTVTTVGDLLVVLRAGVDAANIDLSELIKAREIAAVSG